MKRYIMAAAVAAIGIVASYGADKTRNIRVAGNITEVSAAVGVRIVYIPSATQSVVLTAPDNMIDNVTVSFREGRLKAEYDNKGNSKSSNIGDITVTVKARSVTDFKAAVGSSIIVQGTINASGKSLEFDSSVGSQITATGIVADKIEAEASTGSSVKLKEISVRKVEAESSTGSTITLSGTAGYADLESSTGSSINAGSLRANSGEIDEDITSSIESNINK